MKRAIVIVLDSFGIGASADAATYGDDGANTFLHIARACNEGRCNSGRNGKLHLPNMQKLGLALAGFESSQIYPPLREINKTFTGAWGFAASVSSGKDTTSGHWEMMGLPVTDNWGYFPHTSSCFPPTFIRRFIAETGIPGTLANCHASGTEVINQFGKEHLESRKPICYTSADSVFQIACHESLYSPEELETLCVAARTLLDEYNIARIISRPFSGNTAQGFHRTGCRKDYSVTPGGDTLLDKLSGAGKQVAAVGKIADIFAGQGVTTVTKADGLSALVAATITQIQTATEDTLIFTNLVDFDTQFGHRRDVCGYARELEAFDALLPGIIAAMSSEDLLVLTADHGCDPTWFGSDHTREHVPILLYGESLPPGFIGFRETFADIGQSLASYFGIAPLDCGASFLQQPTT